MDKPQNLDNHVRFDPPFHFLMVPVAVITVLVVGYYLVHSLLAHTFHWLLAWFFLVTVAVTVATFKIRLYALRVQDRVIRMEERLRLTSLLQEPLRSRIGELTDAQFVGLRFASDAELPALVQRTLDEKLSLADIKKAVVDWRPDNSRI
jgi:hypothetical protein